MLGGTNPWPHVDRVSTLLSELRDLRSQTDPKQGPRSAGGKDLAAFRALKVAGELVDEMAGWAVAHQLGLAMERRELRTIEPDLDHRSSPAYRAEVQECDDHRHEQRGNELKRGITVPDRDIDPKAARETAVRLLRANPGAFPDQVAFDLADALTALERRETYPILEPSQVRPKHDLEQRRLELRAVCSVYFRKAAGGRVNIATLLVAQAYGVNEETVRGWRKRYREDFGRFALEQAVGFAMAEGRIRPKDEIDSHPIYGADALTKAGKLHRHISGQQKGSSGAETA